MGNTSYKYSPGGIFCMFGCNANGSNLNCNGSVNANANSYGNVAVNDDSSECGVNSNGFLDCREM